ncbi:hypothetical protein Tco_0577690 [Tanacetum coccineum]
MEDKKMVKQSMDLSLEKLWYLADEDEEEETYVFDINEFSAIQIHNNFSSKSAGTHESLYSTLNEKYDAITCDFSPALEFLLASESNTVVLVYSLNTFEEEYKVESKVFDLLKIDVDLFTYDTHLGMIFDEFSQLSIMEDDLFAYKLGVLEDSYFPCVEQPYDDLENGDLDIYEQRQCYDEYERMFAQVVILIDNRLVKLIDITLEQWLELKFGNHKKVDKEIMEGVVDTWLIRSYRKQFEEYMEIKRRLEVNEINTDVECDPPNVEFAIWLASKFNNHMTMDGYTKNALWIYWKRGDDEEVLTYDELSNLEKENLHEGNKIAKVFKIETDVFLFETPLCKEFEIYQDLRCIMIIKIHGTTNGITKCHGLMKNHGWKMGFGRNLLMIYVINASRFVLKVDMLNGPLVTGEKIYIVVEEIYQE